MEWIGIASLTGIVALVFVFYIAKKVMRQDPGTPEMVAISDAIHEGAMAFLKREYKAIGHLCHHCRHSLGPRAEGSGMALSLFLPPFPFW